MSVSQVELPPGYPREWEADVVLTDGGVARLRPIVPADAQKLVTFYERVSPESKYLRFFAPYPRLSARDVKRFTEVDYVDRVALILTLGDEMIGVGRFDRTQDDQAEVAFLVEDAHQGRGIAQLLLEHLAEAARERGIRGFVAEVLPENRRMAQVFVDAGYRVRKDIEDGVLSVEFPILPTDTSVGVMQRREHRAESASVHRLLHPSRVVVYGGGRRVQALVNAMLCSGFRGEVVAVSSDDHPVSGVPTARSIATVPGRLDLAVLSVPTAALGGVVIDAAHKGAHGVVVLTGTEHAPSDNHTVVNLARAYGIRALGPDALGLINTADAVGMNATPGPMPRLGGVGLFCQSAAVGVALLNRALRYDLGLSSFISTGDYADVTGNDVMQYWEDDEATRVCLLSLDSIGNPRKFSRIARRLTRRKPVVVIEPGRASRSVHSGVRGGLAHAPEEAVDALFRQAGVMVVHRRGAMFDIAKIATRQPLPRGPRVRLVTNSRTLAVQMQQTIADEGDKPLVGVFLDFHLPTMHPDEVDRCGGLPKFDAPADAIQALSALTAYAHWRDRDPGAVPMLEPDILRAKRVVHRVLSAHPQGRELSDDESAEVLAAYGISLVRRYPVASLEEAVAVADHLGWDVALKGTARAVRGRPDQANVHRNLGGEADLAQAWSELGALVSELGLGEDVVVAEPVVQAMAPPGVALVVTSREDAAFGPIVSLGLEGIPSELLGDTVYRVPPLTTVDAAAMVRDLKAAPTLFGRHGSPGVHIAGIEDLLHRVAQLADEVPQLASVSLSPCVASLNGMAVLGARILIAPTDDRRDPMARTL